MSTATIGPGTAKLRAAIIPAESNSLGEPIKVKTLSLGALMDIAAKFDELKLAPPPPLVRLEWLDQFVQDPKDRIAWLETNVRERFGTFLRWAIAQRELVPTLLSSVTDLPKERTLQLDLQDFLRVMTAAFELVDLKLTVELALGFFSQVGVLMETVGLQRAAHGLRKSDDTETTGPSSSSPESQPSSTGDVATS